MFLDLLKRRNKDENLDLDEYLANIESQTIFTNNFQKYMNELRLENRIIDKKLSDEIFVFKNLQIELDEYNLEKIKSKIKKLNEIIDNYHKENLDE